MIRNVLLNTLPFILYRGDPSEQRVHTKYYKCLTFFTKCRQKYFHAYKSGRNVLLIENQYIMGYTIYKYIPITLNIYKLAKSYKKKEDMYRELNSWDVQGIDTYTCEHQKSRDYILSTSNRVQIHQISSYMC